jgi:hypothetical protein
MDICHPLSLKYVNFLFVAIATSDGTQNSLAHKGGGHCKTRNMKLRFHMCNDSKGNHGGTHKYCKLANEKVPCDVMNGHVTPLLKIH